MTLRIARSALLSCAAVALLLASGGCDVPVEAKGGDTPPPATRIEGTIRVLVSNGLPLGPAVLARYDCDDPPAPAGSGRPRDFLIVEETSFTEGEAPFVFPSVPPDSCVLLGGFIDRDRDFHYDFVTAGQATAGDVSITGVLVRTPSGGADWIEPVTGVILRAETVEEYDRPAFELPAEEVGEGEDLQFVYPSMELGAAPGETNTVFTRVDAREFVTELVEVSEPSFQVILGTDLDEDGLPDDDNGDGLPDVDWPRVLLFRLDPGDPTGATESDPRVVIPGVILSLNPFAPLDQSENLMAQAAAQGIPLDGVSRLQRDHLRLAIPGLVVTSSEPLVLTPIESVVASGVEVLGAYRVLVMNPNGQLWFVPNELVAFGLEDQGAFFSVVDEE